MMRAITEIASPRRPRGTAAPSARPALSRAASATPPRNDTQTVIASEAKQSRTLWIALFVGFLLLFQTSNIFAAEQIRAATTTSTLASLLKDVGGKRFDIHYVASPKRDVHFISPTPKDVLKVKKAEVFVHSGLDLEVWRDPLLVAAGNSKFLGNADPSIDLSRGIPLLEIPTVVNRAEGDIHLFGNPHYWIDPENAKIMVNTLAEKLSDLCPNEAQNFKKHAEDFNARIDEKLKDWLNRMAPYQGSAVIVYHRSWPYFAERFGLTIVGEVEPRPGIPPTAKHLAELIQIVKEKKVRAIIREPFNESRAPDKLAERTGIPVVLLIQSVGAIDEAVDYISMIEANIRALETAFSVNSSKQS